MIILMILSSHVEFVHRFQVAAVSGDARRCLDICRRAVEIAESRPETVSRTKKAKEILGMRHVNEALDEMFSSPKIVALR